MAAQFPPGYLVRTPTLDDVDGVVALWNAGAIAENGTPNTIAAQVRREWQRSGFDLATAVRLVVVPSGQIVGLLELRDRGGGAHARLSALIAAHPTLASADLPLHLLRLAEERARAIAALSLADARVVLQVGGWTSARLGKEALAQAGFAPVRTYWRMKIALDEAPVPVWPAGITVRPFVRGRDERAVYEVDTEAFADQWGFVAPPYESWLYDMIEYAWSFDPALWFLALAGETVAGVLLGAPHAEEDPHLGWIRVLAVRRPWRRQGIGLALLQHAFAAFYRRGTRLVGLGVDSQSLTGAERLYRRAGMRVASERHLYEKELRPGRDLAVRALQSS